MQHFYSSSPKIKTSYRYILKFVYAESRWLTPSRHNDGVSCYFDLKCWCITLLFLTDSRKRTTKIASASVKVLEYKGWGEKGQTERKQQQPQQQQQILKYYILYIIEIFTKHNSDKQPLRFIFFYQNVSICTFSSITLPKLCLG